MGTRQERRKQNPVKTYRTFKRGQIIYVNFSNRSKGEKENFTELNGPHYAVVLDKKDKGIKSTVTVLPFSSKYHKSYLNVGPCFYNQLNDRYSSLRLELTDLLKDLANKHKALLEIIYSITEFQNEEDIPEDLRAEWESRQKELEELDNQMEAVTAKVAEVDRLKATLQKFSKDSYAVVGQITTIDKRRVIHSSSLTKALNKIFLEENTFSLILEEIQKRYI